MSRDSKIFCVGFNKTGTTSLHELFKAMGFRSFHGVYSDFVNERDFDHAVFRNHDCFTDGERHDFRALDEAFPGSKFILLKRRMDKWLLSRIKHVHYRKSIGKTGWMRREYEEDPNLAVRAWIRRRRAYYQDLREYFGGREGDYLEINICDSEDEEGLVRELADFLGLGGSEPHRMPRSNVHEDRTLTTLPRRLLSALRGREELELDSARYQNEVDEAFDELGLSEAERRSD